jgi:CubicO group peptidase (beta-lactamase class C family)
MRPSLVRRALLGAAVAFVSLSVAAPAAATPGEGDFDAMARRAFAEGRTPGMAVAVVRDGRIVFEAGYGLADIAKKTAVTPQTPFSIGSITKQFTAVSILMLAAQGRLSLDDPLAKYLPKLPNAATITLRQLLWQTSGLHSYPLTTEHDWPLRGPIDSSAILAILATDKPDFGPGSRWEYSNANYAALARVVEIASRLRYGEFLQKNVFAPLEMSGSGYGYAAQQALPLATAYTGAAPFSKPPMTISLDLYFGAGGVVASAHDMALWMNGLLAHRLLDPGGLAEAWTAGRLADGTATAYGMGFMVASVDGHRQVWHNGYAPYSGGYCYEAIYPDDGVGIVILTNGDMDNAGAMPERLARALFTAMYPPVAASAAPGEDAAVTALVKRYWSQMAAGNVALDELTPSFAEKFTPQFQAQLSSGLAALGAPASWTFAGKYAEANGSTRYEYRLDLPSGPRTFAVWLTPERKISGSYLKP